MENKLGSNKKKSKTENDPKLKFGIDRKQENKDVRMYVKSGNEEIFNRLYENRLPTIDFLARRYKWLCEDAASEIRIVLVRSVNKYREGQTTDFNTYFFTSVKNHFSNLAKKRFRKKRTTFDGLDPLHQTIPLDSFIDDEENSSKFHELISDGNSDSEKCEMMEHYLYHLSGGNRFLLHVIKEFSDMSKRKISKKEISFDFKFDLVTGDLFEDVSKQIGLPKRMFDIVKAKVRMGAIDASVKVKGKKLIEHFVEKIESEREELECIKG